LQNIPSRTELGRRVRECFVPDVGHAKWVKFDYSQVHYRILAHNAVGPGAHELRQRYINDPATDYHLDVYMKVAPLLGWSTTDEKVIKVKRRPIKNVNFGLLYGQSIPSLAFKSGLSGADAEAFFKAYFQGAPYVKPTMAAIEAEMQAVGFVTTLLGRRIRFNEYEPARREKGQKVTPLPYHAALREWGAPLKYAYGYRAVNYKFQGSEPDIMKKGMYDCYKSGVYDYLGVPRLTVHDENDLSIKEDNPATREALAFVKNTMENTLKLRIPLKTDMSEGPNWGNAD
jgi:DNA polymerase I-like protein with 3'-5' exonuclease and polymerase domains